MDSIYDGRLWAWRFNRCYKCRVVVLPSVVRWFDPAWLKYRWDRRHANRD